MGRNLGWGTFIVNHGHFFPRRIWNTNNGQCLKTLTENREAIWSVAYRSSANDVTNAKPSQQVQFSPNSKYILSTAHDSAIRLWDYQSSRCLKTYTDTQMRLTASRPASALQAGNISSRAARIIRPISGISRPRISSRFWKVTKVRAPHVSVILGIPAHSYVL
jgi:WD40 repeat protein